MSEPTGTGWGAPDPTPVPGSTPAPGWDGTPAPGSATPAQSGQGLHGQGSDHQAPPPRNGQPGWGALQAPGQPVGGESAWSGQQGWTGQPGWGPPVAEAPRPGVVPLRPLGLGEMLDGSLRLVRGYSRAALGVSAVVALVTTLVQLLLVFTVLQPLLDIDTAAVQSGDTDALVSLLAGAGSAVSVTVVLSTVSSALMTGFLTAIAGEAVLGRPLTLEALWRSVRGKVGRLVGGSLLLGLAVYGPPVVAGLLAALLVAVAGAAGGVLGVLLVLASLVGALLAWVRLSLATSVIVLEDAGVVRSFRRSWGLVRRSFWRVLGVLVLALVISSLVAQVVQLPFSLLSGGGGPLAALSGGTAAVSGLSTRALVLSAVGAGVASTLVAPFVAGVRALLYVDRRMRAEGLDVALQAAAAARP